MKRKVVTSIAVFCAILMMQIAAAAANIGFATHMQAPHNGNNVEGILRLIDNVNSEWVRDELRWGWGMETVQGELNMSKIDWTDDAYDKGVNSLVILGYGNTIYNPEGVEDEYGVYVPTVEYTDYFNAYLDYVRLVAAECKGKVQAYEIWNEPNHRDFNYQIQQNKYSYTASDYFELLKASHDVIEEVDPDAKIVGGSVLLGGTVTSGWMEELFRAGAGEYMDAFSFHVYTYKDDDAETAMRAAYDRVEKVLDDYGFDGEVWITETGYYSGTADYSVSEREQASLVIRSKVIWDDYLNDNNRTGEFFWYDLRNDGTDEAAAGNNFGLTTYGYVPKEGFYSAKAYNELLNEKELVSLTTSEDGYDYIALYEGADKELTDKVYIAYKKGNYASPINIPVSGDAAYIYDYQGNLIGTEDTSSGNLSLTFTDTTPVFVHCADYVTEIESIGYDDLKNFCTISGRAEYLEYVTVELIIDGEKVQTETVKVKDDGSFTKAFQVDNDGDYLVRVGKPEIEEKGGTHYAEQEFAMYRDTDKMMTIGINCLTEVETGGMKVNLSGLVNGGEQGQQLSLALVPQGSTELSKAVYMGEAITNENGEFELSFKIPQSVPHIYHYTLYVRGAETELKQSNVDYIIGSGEVLSYDFMLDLSDGVFTASAYVKNVSANIKTPVILIAQYDENGLLIDIIKQEISTEASEDKKLLSVTAAQKVSAKNCRAYIWDGVESLKPIAPAISMGL